MTGFPLLPACRQTVRGYKPNHLLVNKGLKKMIISPLKKPQKTFGMIAI
jgi:hypothetical protein